MFFGSHKYTYVFVLHSFYLGRSTLSVDISSKFTCTASQSLIQESLHSKSSECWKCFLRVCRRHIGDVNVFDYRACASPLGAITWNVVNASYFSKIQKSQNSEIPQLYSFWIRGCRPIVRCLEDVAQQAKRQGRC